MKNEQLTNQILESVESTIQNFEEGVDRELRPIRKSVLKRFPTLFLLTVTFGVTLVMYSLELILSRTQLVIEYPWVAFFSGICILIITGTLYRKLG